MGTIPESKKTIANVTKQLEAGFLPAVKGTAEAGTKLLQAFMALQRAADGYTLALSNLAGSARTAEEPAQEQGQTLLGVAKELKDIVQHHERSMKKFAEMNSRVVKFSHEEKAKQKEFFHNHLKEEKNIHKSRAPESQMTEFYQKECGKFAQAQMMRYKFFVDKHGEWFRTYADLGEYVVEMSKGISLLAKPDADELRRGSEQVNGARESESEANEEETETETQPTEGGESRRPTTLTEENHRIRGDTRETTELLESEKSEKSERDRRSTKESEISHTAESRVSSIEGIQTRTNTETNPDAVVLIREQTLEITQVPPTQVNREVYQERTIHRETREVVETPVYHDEYAEERARSPLPPPREQSMVNRQQGSDMMYSNFNRPMDSRPAVPIVQARRPSPGMDEYSVLVRPVPAYKPASVQATPIMAPPRSYQRQEINPPRVASPPPPAVRQSNPVPAIVPSQFSASDYNRKLIVTTDFNSYGPEQLTVNKDDIVVLIKSGNRGWIFIKDDATERTGWIPAPYAELL